MKELFGQSTVNELSDSDRIASAVPGQVAAKNILFSKFWLQLKTIFGVNNWSARTYSSSPCIIVYENKQYILDETLAPLPFNSTDFTTELSDGKWLPLGSSILLASQSEAESNTENTKYLSSLRTFQNWINNVKTYAISDLTTDVKTVVGAINELIVKLGLKAMQNPGICQECPILPIDIVIDPVANTLTIATVKGGQAISASNPIRFFTDGGGIIKKWEYYAPVTFPNFTNTYGVWYFHFDNLGQPIATQTAWTDFNSIATVYRFLLNDTLSDAEKIVVRSWECHLNDQTASDHEWKHAQGTIYVSGFDIVNNKSAHTNGVPTASPNADGRNTVISLTTGKNSDDGLGYTVTNTTTPSNKFEQDLGIGVAASLNATNSGLFKVRINDTNGKLYFLPATRFPFPFNATNNKAQYITSAGVRTDMPDNRWFNVYVYALQDDKPTEAVKVVTSEVAFATYAEAQAHDFAQIQAIYATFRDKELRNLYKLTFYHKAGGGGAYNVGCKFAALIDVIDNRTAKPITSSVSGSGASNTLNVSLSTPLLGQTNQDGYNVSNELDKATESYFVTAINEKEYITRNYNFKVTNISATSGTITLLNSSEGAYTEGATVTANDYISISGSVLNSRLFIKVERV